MHDDHFVVAEDRPLRHKWLLKHELEYNIQGAGSA